MLRYKSTKFLIVGLIFLYTLLQGQSPMQVQLTTQDGLPSNVVYRAIEDNKGIMWFCTEKGLAKFDGYEFTVYNTNNGLPHNDIFDIYFDDDKIWLSTFDTISYIKNEKVFGLTKPDQFKNSSLYRHVFPSKKLHLIIFDKEKKFVLVQKDSFQLLTDIPESELLFKIRNAEEFSTIYRNRENKLSYLRVYNNGELKSEFKLHSTTSLNVYEHIEINDRRYLFEKDSVYIWDSKQLDRLAYTDLWGNNPDVYNVKHFSDRIILLGNRDSYVLDENLNIIENYDYLLDPEIKSVTKDGNDNIWACGTNGVSFFLDREKSSVVYEIPNRDDKFIGIECFKSNQIYLCTRKGRVFDLGKSGLRERYNFNLSKVKSWKIDDLGEYCYLLDADEGIRKFDFDNNEIPLDFEEGEVRYSKKEFDLHGNDKLAFSYSYGVKVLDSNGIETVFGKRAYAVCYQQDTIWIGTTKGLYKYADNTAKYIPLGKKEIYVKSIFQDQNNSIWVVPDRTGLWKMENGELKKISFTDDLYINKLAVDDDEGVWLATSTGLYHFVLDNERQNYERKKYGYSDGIDSENIIDVQVIKDKVFAISDQDLFVFDRNQVRKGKKTYFNFESFSVNQEEVKVDKLQDLNFSENDIVLNFSCISQSDFGNIHYRWKMDPLHKDWQETKSTSLQFSSLSPNDYTLRIKAYDSNDYLIHGEQIIPITINPPWYLTNWFLIALALLMFLGFYLYDIWRKNQQNKTIEIENQIQQQFYELKLRAVRAQMNPHFIFNALNSIQKFIYQKSPEEANHYIVQFSKLMRMILESTSQSYTSLEEEIKMLKLYASLEQMRFNNIFVYEIDVDKELDQKNTYLPSIVIQPFVENAINHGLAPKDSKGKLLIRFFMKGSNLICEIEDNGIGREKSKTMKKMNHTSMALKIIEERKDILKESENYNFDFEFIDLYDDIGHPCGTKITIFLPLDFEHDKNY